MAVLISRALRAQMLAEAASAPEREICGLLFGQEGRNVTAIQPCANVAANPARTFEIDPAALIAAHKAQRAGGARLIGWYHSHPGGRAEPSLHDREAALDGRKLWLIVAANEIRAWNTTGVGAFEEAELEWTD